MSFYISEIARYTASNRAIVVEDFVNEATKKFKWARNHMKLLKQGTQIPHQESAVRLPVYWLFFSMESIKIIDGLPPLDLDAGA